MYRWQYASEPTSPEAAYILSQAEDGVTRTDVAKLLSISEKAAAGRLAAMYRAGYMTRTPTLPRRYTSLQPWLWIDANRRKIKCEQRARPEGQMRQLRVSPNSQSANNVR